MGPRLLTLVFHPSGSGKCICSRVRRHGNKSAALKQRVNEGGFQGGTGAKAVILKSETYNFHRLDLTRQAGFLVTVSCQ